MATLRKQIIDEVQRLFTEYLVWIDTYTYTYSASQDTIQLNRIPIQLHIVYIQAETAPDPGIDDEYLTDVATGWTFDRPEPSSDSNIKTWYFVSYDESNRLNFEDMYAVTAGIELQPNQEVTLYYAAEKIPDTDTDTPIPTTHTVNRKPIPVIPDAWHSYDTEKNNHIFTVQTQTYAQIQEKYFETISNRFANPLHINVNSMPFVSIGYGNTQKQQPFIAQDLRNIFSMFIYITHTDNRPCDIFLLDVSDEIHEIVESIVEELDGLSFIDDTDIRNYDGCELGSVKTVAGKFTDREFMEFRLDFTLEKTRDPGIFDPDEDDMI